MFKQIHKETGQHHPAALTKPALRGDCIKYLDAFRLLSASRMWEQVGPQPIPVSEVLKLTKEGLGIDDYEERMKYVRLVQLMDQIEIRYFQEKTKRA